MKSTAIGATGLMVLKSQTVFTANANSKIHVGILGCGGRGHYIARMMTQHGENDLHITALQDPFADRINHIKDAFDVSDDKCFVGIDTYKDLVDSGVDAVAITSPPYFHPAQVEYAVAQGKHIWLAKPVAVDVPGCQSILESSRKAQGKQTFLVDFQTRNAPHFMECVKRVHEGQIGDLVLGHVYYHAGRLGRKDREGMSRDEARLRNWVFDIELSGDIIVEQNIHVLDVANWYINNHPVKAYGTGGRKARVDAGDCWDHFIVTFWYPGDVTVDFSSAQFTKGYDDLCIRMYGSKGTADSHYGGHVRITGDNAWNGTDGHNTMDIGVTNNVRDFVESIRSGKHINHGDYSVQSTLTAVLGRMAAYENREVTWDEMMKSGKKFEVELEI